VFARRFGDLREWFMEADRMACARCPGERASAGCDAALARLRQPGRTRICSTFLLPSGSAIGNRDCALARRDEKTTVRPILVGTTNSSGNYSGTFAPDFLAQTDWPDYYFTYITSTPRLRGRALVRERPRPHIHHRRSAGDVQMVQGQADTSRLCRDRCQPPDQYSRHSHSQRPGSQADDSVLA